MEESIRDKLLDEVALEGLDGLTFQGLWLRLSVRLGFPEPFSIQTKQRFWLLIQEVEEISVYQLPQPRDNLIIYDRNKYLDDYISSSKEVKSIYPHHLVEEDGVVGSCRFYKERINVTKNLKDVEIKDIIEKWGENQHVLVANQDVRYRTLVPSNSNIILTALQYCVLERIGRSRYNGETTVGLQSLQDTCESSKALFYLRRTLQQHKLITKQMVPVKNQLHGMSGNVHHLPRFYVLVKPKSLIYLEKIVGFLKTKPDCLAVDEEVKQLLGNPIDLKRYTKMVSFQEVMRTDIKLPYRSFNPNAEKSEYQWKNGEEIMVRCFQLIDPDVDLSAYYKQHAEEEDVIKPVNDMKNYIDLPLALQAYRIIEQHGSRGISQNELAAKMGQPRLNARAVCRTLIRRNCICLFLESVGKQRIKKFIAKQHIKYSQLKQLMDEHSKILQTVNQCKTEPNPLKRPREEDENVEVVEPSKKCKIDKSILPNKNIIHTHTDYKNIITSIEHVIPSTAKFASSFNLPITYKYLKRANFLLKFVNEKKVVFNLKELESQLEKFNVAQENEKNSNNYLCYDKKTIVRSLYRLASEGHIKIYNVYLTYKNQAKVLTFYCDPSVDHDNPTITSEIDRGKIVYFAVPASNTISRPSRTLGKSLKLGEKINGKLNGYASKFIRMRSLHKFLFHLIYDFKSDSIHSTTAALDKWKSEHDFELSDELLSELPEQVYSLELSWQTFLDPLNPIEWPQGWFLMADILFKIPLVIFTKIVNVRYQSKKLTEYLEHPIKKFLPLKYLPEELRQLLCYARNYIYAVYDILLNLCLLGLVQLGPQRLKMKDQIYVYLNRNASIWDTTSSEKRYLYVSDKKYPVLKFKLKTSKDVSRYWHDLMHICINTKLTLSSKYEKILTIPSFDKPELQHAFKVHLAEEVEAFDTGVIPGDNRGAGGLDSSLFSHLKHNWSMLTQKAKRNPENGNPSVILKSRLQKLCKRRVAGNDVKKRKVDKPAVKVKHEKRPKEKKVRNRKRNPYYDDVDREAVKRMNEMRVSWTREEDHLLLMCKLGYIFLAMIKRGKYMVNFPLIRDCLHRIVGSYNKTAQVCQRRIANMMKSPQTSRSVSMCLEEINQSHEITSMFRKILAQERHNKDVVFLVLLKMLMLKYNGSEETTVQDVIPDTLQELNDKFTFYIPTLMLNKIEYYNPKSIDEIHTNAISSVIHSSLCCCYDKINWNLQLYKIYQNYPETLLRSAISHFKETKLITSHKGIMKYRTPPMNILSIPFHLSFYYKHNMITSFPYDIFHDTYLVLKQLHSEAINNENHEYIGSSGGSAAFLFELGVANDLNLQIKIPENAILLDPRIKNDTDKAYEQIFKRCRNLSKPIISADELSGMNTSQEPTPSTSSEVDDSTNLTLQMIQNDEETEDKIYNFHDHFIVNASRIFFTDLKTSNLPSIDPDNNKIILNKILSRTILNSKEDNNVLVALENLGANENDLLIHYQIVAFIHNCQMMGTTYEILQNNFPMEKGENRLSLSQILEVLCDEQLVFKFGISDFVYVHRNHSHHWMVKSFKMKRLQSEAIDGLDTSESNKNLINIQIHLSPWIRVDGSINRRVLDRWLGTILSYCIDKPGVSMMQLLTRFKFLKPTETKSLVEILLTLKCLKIFKFSSPSFTLFCSYKTSSIVPAVHLDEKNVFIETDPQAITKLGAFIGDKQYKFDFASLHN